MYKKTINYVDYDGNSKKKECWFNLNKAELLKLQMSVKGGYQGYVQRIIDAEDQPTLIELFEDLIKRSYGIKTPEGGFAKPREAYEEFITTEAYSELFMELATDAEAASEFVNGIIPANLAQQLAESNVAPTI